MYNQCMELCGNLAKQKIVNKVTTKQKSKKQLKPYQVITLEMGPKEPANI